MSLDALSPNILREKLPEPCGETTILHGAVAFGEVWDVPVHELNTDLHERRDKKQGARFEMDRARFYGVPDEATATKMLTDGWPEGLQRVHDLARDLTATLPPAPNIRRRLRWDEDGDDFDRERWLEGEEHMFLDSRREVQPLSNVVSLAFAWGGNCTESIETMTWSGVVALAATMALEAAGYSVALTAVANVTHYGSGSDTSVVHLKRPGEDLSASHLAAVLCHGVSYRLHHLRLTETLPFAVGDGYGKTLPLSERVVQQLQETGILEADTVTVTTVRNRSEAETEIVALIGRLHQHGASK